MVIGIGSVIGGKGRAMESTGYLQHVIQMSVDQLRDLVASEMDGAIVEPVPA